MFDIFGTYLVRIDHQPLYAPPRLRAPRQAPPNFAVRNLPVVCGALKCTLGCPQLKSLQDLEATSVGIVHAAGKEKQNSKPNESVIFSSA